MAGGTAAFSATGNAASGEGNVNIIGSNIDAKNVLLQANNQVIFVLVANRRLGGANGCWSKREKAVSF